MKKVTVEMCAGTTCFVMGASGLRELTQILETKFPNQVVVTGRTCLGLCAEKSAFSKAPFVKVDDVVVAEASVEKVLKAVEGKLNNG